MKIKRDCIEQIFLLGYNWKCGVMRGTFLISNHNYIISIATFRKLALSLPETREQPHFNKTSFRVAKKIFATCDEQKQTASLKLSEKDQDIFSLAGKECIYPVPNKWGTQGWTIVDLKKVHKALFEQVLRAAYLEVSPGKLRVGFTEDSTGLNK